MPRIINHRSSLPILYKQEVVPDTDEGYICMLKYSAKWGCMVLLQCLISTLIACNSSNGISQIVEKANAEGYPVLSDVMSIESINNDEDRNVSFDLIVDDCGLLLEDYDLDFNNNPKGANNVLLARLMSSYDYAKTLSEKILEIAREKNDEYRMVFINLKSKKTGQDIEIKFSPSDIAETLELERKMSEGSNDLERKLLLQINDLKLPAQTSKKNMFVKDVKLRGDLVVATVEISGNNSVEDIKSLFNDGNRATSFVFYIRGDILNSVLCDIINDMEAIYKDLLLEFHHETTGNSYQIYVPYWKLSMPE